MIQNLSILTSFCGKTKHQVYMAKNQVLDKVLWKTIKFLTSLCGKTQFFDKTVRFWQVYVAKQNTKFLTGFCGKIKHQVPDKVMCPNTNFLTSFCGKTLISWQVYVAKQSVLDKFLRQNKTLITGQVFVAKHAVQDTFLWQK